MRVIETLRIRLRLLRFCYSPLDKIIVIICTFINLVAKLLLRLKPHEFNEFDWLALSRRMLRRPVMCYSPKIKSWFHVNDYSSFILFDLEDPVVKVFQPMVGDVVVDIGAHQGRYTMLAARLVRKLGTVVAVEPHPENFKTLVMNVKLNKLANVIPINKAAYNKNMFLELYESTSSAWHSIDAGCPLRLGSEIRRKLSVRAMKMDDLLQEKQLEKVDWVKIDVEGAEHKVLRGMEETLKKNNLRLVIEVHSADNGKFLSEYLQKLSYENKIIGIRTKNKNPDHFYTYAYKVS